MVELMREYGSEVSETISTPRVTGGIQKASIIRQFRRWNPNFFQYFERRNGQWVPKLGKQAELDRRAKARQRGGSSNQHQGDGAQTSHYKSSNSASKSKKKQQGKASSK